MTSDAYIAFYSSGFFFLFFRTGEAGHLTRINDDDDGGGGEFWGLGDGGEVGGGNVSV